MTFDPSELEKYPEIMNLEQMRIVCHINKRTAAYLLQTGLVPCKMTGKKTRCYRVRKDDVIAFILDRETNPDRYIYPRNWKQGNPATKRIRVIPPMPNQEEKRRYYTQKLQHLPDVISVKQICEITGYNPRTVRSWLLKGHIRYIAKTNKFYVIKKSFIDYLCSSQYEVSHRKSHKHIDMLWEIRNENKGKNGGQDSSK